MTAPAGLPEPADHRVEPAEKSDSGVLSRVVADAFFDLDVSRWLVPDPGARRGIFPSYFRIFVQHALAEGTVLTTPARDAAALWLPVGPDGPIAPPGGYHQELAAIAGPHLPRFAALDDTFNTHHPIGVAHEHLAILAVSPGRQRLGIGTAMLQARHAFLDAIGMPAYLEASDPAKRDIYLEHGYALRPDAPIRLPDGGPEMFPMWREPQPAAMRGAAPPAAWSRAGNLVESVNYIDPTGRGVVGGAYEAGQIRRLPGRY